MFISNPTFKDPNFSNGKRFCSTPVSLNKQILGIHRLGEGDVGDIPRRGWDLGPVLGEKIRGVGEKA